MYAQQFLIGAAFAALIAFTAYRAHALTRSGAFAAFFVGTLTYGFGGIAFTAVLLAFFIPSVALSRLGKARKNRLIDIGKGGARDAAQVLANGGIATICAVFAGALLMPTIVVLKNLAATSKAFPLATHFHAAIIWYAAFAGAYAAATADTWATEIGTLFKQPPRSILTGRAIATGLSGGITVPGTLAEVAGAAWIAGVAVLALNRIPFAPQLLTYNALHLTLAITAAGIIGATVDSLLGATLQELRHCPTCERTCETNPHACGIATERIRGLNGFSNDRVNAAATLTGAATAALLMLV